MMYKVFFFLCELTICLKRIPCSINVLEMNIECLRWTLSSAVPCTTRRLLSAKYSSDLKEASVKANIPVL